MIIQSNETKQRYFTQMKTPSQDIFKKQYVANSLEQALAEQYCQHHHYILSNDHTVMDKLKKVGLSNYALVDRFGLGYVDRSFLKTLPHRDSFEGTSDRGRLQRLGLLTPVSRGIFHGSIIFPLYYDIYYRVIGIYGYWVNPRKGHAYEYSTFWCSEGLGIFNQQSFDAYKDLIVCHSPRDACQLIEAGYENAVAILGNGENEEQFYELFRHQPTESVALVSGETESDELWKVQLTMALQSLNIEVRTFTNA